jgi:predicted CopG family antitoxin
MIWTILKIIRKKRKSSSVLGRGKQQLSLSFALKGMKKQNHSEVIEEIKKESRLNKHVSFIQLS